MEKNIENEFNSKEQSSKEQDKGFIIRMPIKMHNELKISALILNKNMQNIVIDAVDDKLNQLKKDNDKIAFMANDDSSKNDSMMKNNN